MNGTMMLSTLSHPAKAPNPISVKLSGSLISEMAVFANAPSSTLLTPLFTVRFASEVHPANAFLRM